MDPKITFWFYLAAVICFAIAAIGDAWRFGRLGRRNLAPRLALVPLGLALYVFPSMWTLGKQVF